MNTMGYDLLVQIDERLLNKGLAALFYTGQLKYAGEYAFVQGVPESLRGFTETFYQVRLRNEPFIDFMYSGKVADENVKLRFSFEVVLTVLTGVRFELDVDLTVSARINVIYHGPKCKVVLDMTNAKVYDILINDRFQFYQNTLDRINQILKILLEHHFSNIVKEIDLNVAFSHVYLPEIPQEEGNQLPVKLEQSIIFDKQKIVIAINFFGHTGGNIDGVTDMSGGMELFVAMQHQTILQIMKFWWEKTSLKKSIDFEGVVPVKYNQILRKGSAFLLRLITLGIIQPESEVKSAYLIYNGTITLNELPDIQFSKADKVTISKLVLKLKLNAYLEIETINRTFIDSSGLIPDGSTPWEDDKKISEKIKKDKKLQISEDCLVTLENALCEIQTDKNNNLTLKIIKADLVIDLGKKWIEHFTESLVNKLLDFIENSIVVKLPPFVISPAHLLSDTDIAGYSFQVDLKNIDIDDSEICVSSNISINELSDKGVAFPLYIANKKSKKLHRFDCQTVEEIDFSHRAGYHGVGEAIVDGYVPCGQCLRGYIEK